MIDKTRKYFHNHKTTIIKTCVRNVPVSRNNNYWLKDVINAILYYSIRNGTAVCNGSRPIKKLKTIRIKHV